MIGQISNDVIVHMAMTPATIRFGGQDVKVLRASGHGFCWVEFDASDPHPISHPLEEWLMSLINSGITPGTSSIGSVYFVIDAPGDRSNDGQDDKTTSVNNLQWGF